MRRYTAALSLTSVLVAQGVVLAAPTPAVSSMPNSFIYVVNDYGDNTVSGFQIADDGSLVGLPGSPYSTGGKACGGSGGVCVNAYYGSVSAGIVRSGNRLYVANMGSDPATVSGFNLDPNTGVPTLITGSPWSLSFGGAYSLAIHPSGNFLYAASGVQLAVDALQINADGTLGAPFEQTVGVQTDGFAVSPTGEWLALAGARQGVTELHGIDQSSGHLVDLGWPTAHNAQGVAFDPTRRGRLFLVDAAGYTASLSVRDSGWNTLGDTNQPGQTATVSQDGSRLFVGLPNANAVIDYGVDGAGGLTETGFAFTSTEPDRKTTGVAFEDLRGLLFAANLLPGQPGRLYGWSVGGDGTFTPSASSPTTLPNGLARSVIAWTPWTAAKLTDGLQTCASVFQAQTATSLTSISYSDKSGKFGSVSPGVFYYWARVHVFPGAPSGRLVVAQLANSGASLFLPQQESTRLYDQSCNPVRNVSLATDSGRTTLTGSGVAAGDYYIAVKLSASALTGRSEPTASQVHLSFTSGLGAATVSLDLVRKR